MAETTIKQLEAEIEQLNRLVRQREEDTRCTKMMLKFREEKIQRMEILLGGLMPADTYLVEENKALFEEIQQLRAKVDKNPEVTRFALENIRLLEQLRRYQDFYEEGERDMLLTEVSESRDQLLLFLDGDLKQHNSPDKNLPSKEAECISAENDSPHLELKKTLNELEQCRSNLNSCLENNAKLSREIDDLQASLNHLKSETNDNSNIDVTKIVRLLANHPYFDNTLMTADRKAGQSIGSVFPHLATQDFPDMVAVKDADFSDVDAVFCCLPHGTTQEIIKSLPTRLKIVDLSADFRLRDVSEYEEWYGQPHKATDLQKEAVYGLTEILRTEIQSARLVANPGCFPTSILLPLIPLINAKLIEVKNIIIDSKSGVSGAGRGAKEANLYTEIAEGIHSYGVTRHRHAPEIEQGLSDAAHSKVTMSFPHLMPMSRGMQSTIYVEMAPD